MRRALFPILAIGALTALLLELTLHLQSFPGLHGDEAWVGLRAIEILSNGSLSIHGMNTYSGALFPHLIAAVFSAFGASVFSLRLPSTILNIVAVGILVIAFRRQRRVALTIILLFASSLCFLFYSRLAWEVTAFENLLISIIIASTVSVEINARARNESIIVFFTAFTLGTFNHFIFTAAALSFAVTAALVVSRSINSRTSRLFLIGLFNLPLQLFVVLIKPFVLDGPFVTHGLPSVLIGFLLIGATTASFIRLEPVVLALARHIHAERPQIHRKAYKYLVSGIVGCFLIVAPFNGLSFLGMLSGIIEMERITSYAPATLESVFLYIRATALLLAFGWLVYLRHNIPPNEPEKVVKDFLLVWPLVFLVAMQIETLGLSDRYFIIPLAIFFVAIALSMDQLSTPLRLGVQIAVVLGLFQAQIFYIQELMRASSRRPLDFRYWFYFDTSRHFMRLEGLEQFLRQKGVCRVTSSTYFISRPINFLMKAPACPQQRTAHVEYCIGCKSPAAGFAITQLGVAN